MIDDSYQDFSSDSRVINNFDLLKQIGIIDYFENQNNEIRNLDDLLNAALEIFNRHTVIDLINYLTKKLLDKFIPSYLAFILEEEFNPNNAYVICFKNMQIIQNYIKIDSIKQYNKFFTLSPTSITFEAFKKIIDKKELANVFLPLQPELLVPMMGLDGLYGLIIFGTKIVGEKYKKQELNYINRIMKFASISLQNIINYRRSIYDFKTKLYNHSFFVNKIEEELIRVKRYNSEVSLLMIDIDNFKIINDNYGHSAGDGVLVNIANVILTNIRKIDIASRFGGDEFVIILVETNLKSAWVVAERIRKIIEKMSFNYCDNTYETSISCGVSCSSSEEFYESKELIDQADSALYKSKENGRNQTTVFNKDKMSIKK